MCLTDMQHKSDHSVFRHKERMTLVRYTHSLALGLRAVDCCKILICLWVLREKLCEDFQHLFLARRV